MDRAHSYFSTLRPLLPRQGWVNLRCRGSRCLFGHLVHLHSEVLILCASLPQRSLLLQHARRALVLGALLTFCGLPRVPLQPMMYVPRNRRKGWSLFSCRESDAAMLKTSRMLFGLWRPCRSAVATPPTFSE